MQSLRRPQEKPNQPGSFSSIPHSRINIMTSTQFLRSVFTSLSLQKLNKFAVPTAAAGTDISLSQATERVLPDDGSSGRARQGSSKQGGANRFRRLVEFGLRALLRAAACVYGRFVAVAPLDGCWGVARSGMDVCVEGVLDD
jgi:hypothetical protein